MEMNLDGKDVLFIGPSINTELFTNYGKIYFADGHYECDVNDHRGKDKLLEVIGKVKVVVIQHAIDTTRQLQTIFRFIIRLQRHGRTPIKAILENKAMTRDPYLTKHHEEQKQFTASCGVNSGFFSVVFNCEGRLIPADRIYLRKMIEVMTDSDKKKEYEETTYGRPTESHPYKHLESFSQSFLICEDDIRHLSTEFRGIINLTEIYYFDEDSEELISRDNYQEIIRQFVLDPTQDPRNINVYFIIEIESWI